MWKLPWFDLVRRASLFKGPIRVILPNDSWYFSVVDFACLTVTDWTSPSQWGKGTQKFKPKSHYATPNSATVNKVEQLHPSFPFKIKKTYNGFGCIMQQHLPMFIAWDEAFPTYSDLFCVCIRTMRHALRIKKNQWLTLDLSRDHGRLVKKFSEEGATLIASRHAIIRVQGHTLPFIVRNCIICV